MSTDTVPKWSLGDRLRKARQVAGIRSHKEMAQRLGVSEDTIKRWEGDKYSPSRGYVLGWALECGVDPQWLENEGGDGADSRADHLYQVTAELDGQLDIFNPALDLCLAA